MSETGSLGRFGSWEILSRDEIEGGGFDALARDVNGREVRLWVGERGSGEGAGDRPAVDGVEAALSKVYHASLPRVSGTAVVEGRAVVAVTPYRGRSLADRLREGIPSIPEGLDLVRSVAAGLVKAHRVGVVHGAVTTREILLADDGRTLLLHAGFGPFLGSRAARAPEDPATGPRPESSDVYALSRVLLECLLGEDPLSGASGAGLPPDALPAAWPEGLRRFLARSVAADPARRIHRAEEFAGDLAVIRASWDARDRPPPVVGPGPDRRIILAGGVAAIVALALAMRSCGS